IVAPVVDYWITAENQPPVLPFQTRAFINHSRFNTATDYTSEVTAGVKDLYQNCLYPSVGPGCVLPNPPGQPCCCEGAWNICPCP
ncbi:MAG: hypothetical protein U9O55_02085, partial [Patescibacteria group bacterium]|nr:hypothetical protein [Patescibacteria group bacterium]